MIDTQPRVHVSDASPQANAAFLSLAVGKVEFKKGSDSGVLSQAVSYLSWLESAHHDVEALVRKVLGVEAAESIDWRRSRMVCIAADFSHHDRVAVQRLPERIDLVRYRIFEGGLLSLLLVDSSPGFPTAASSRRNRKRETAVDVAAAVPVTPSPAGASLAPKCLRDLYAEVDVALTAWGEIKVALLRHYIAYRRLVNLATYPGHGRAGGGLHSGHARHRAPRDRGPGGTARLSGRPGEGGAVDPTGV